MKAGNLSLVPEPSSEPTLLRDVEFIEMPVKAEAEAAIAGLKGKDLKGRSLDVNEARPREDRKPRRDGGGGRNRY